MIEWALSGLMSLFGWLWNSAMTLYLLAGFFIAVGGLIMFIGSVLHHFWKSAAEQRPHSVSAQSRVTVHVENLNVTLEMTEPQLRRLLAERDLPALESGDHKTQEDDYE